MGTCKNYLELSQTQLSRASFIRWWSWESKGLFQGIKSEARPPEYFPPSCKNSDMVFPGWFPGAHRQATDAKCYCKDPFDQLINDYLLQGTVLGTMESTWKIRPKSLPSRSLQSSWEDKAYIQGNLSNNTGVKLKCKITVQESSKSSTWLITRWGASTGPAANLEAGCHQGLECGRFPQTSWGWSYPRSVGIRAIKKSEGYFKKRQPHAQKAQRWDQKQAVFRGQWGLHVAG